MDIMERTQVSERRGEAAGSGGMSLYSTGFGGRDTQSTAQRISGLLEHGFIPRSRERELIRLAQREPESNRGRRARERLVRSNMKLVASQISKRRHLPESCAVTWEDLFQAGTSGLLEAIDRFDLSFEGGLGGYASVRIAKRMQQCIRGGARTVRLPDSIEDTLARIRRENRGCEEALEEYEEELLALERAATYPVSVDAGESGDETFYEGRDFPGPLHPDCNTEEVLSAEEETLSGEGSPVLNEGVRLALAALPEELVRVVHLRYGLPGGDTEAGAGLSFKDIGEHLGCSGERARVLHERVIPILREAAEDREYALALAEGELTVLAEPEYAGDGSCECRNFPENLCACESEWLLGGDSPEPSGGEHFNESTNKRYREEVA